MIHVCRVTFEVRKKTVSSNGPYCKVNRESTKGPKCLLFGTVRDKISTFVM